MLKGRARNKNGKHLRLSPLVVVAIILSAFVLPTIVTVTHFTTSVSAADRAENYTIKLYDDRGSEVIASTSVANRSLFMGDGNSDVVLSYSVGRHGSYDSGTGNYDDCVLSEGRQCILLVRNAEGHTVASVVIPADSLSKIQNAVQVVIEPEGTTCDMTTTDNGCIGPTMVAAYISPSIGNYYSDNYSTGGAPSVTISREVVDEQYYNQEEEEERTRQEQEVAAAGTTSCSIWAGLMSWLICSLVDWISGFLDWIYNEVISPILVFDPTLLSTNNEAYSVWSNFRDIANVLIVLFLLFVIFSQVTGFGIDNYGIKKSLPKIIIAAVIINLSYFICQFAIDISNIVGSGIGSILNSAAGDSTNLAGYFGTGIGQNLGEKAGVTTLFAAAVAIGAVWVVRHIFLALAMLAGAVVSFLFMFLILAARRALIILLVIVSPLAFVCYSLPNTKGIFDKWWNLLKTMLFLYPICGLVIGGGTLASRIILSSMAGATTTTTSNVLAIVVAVIAEVGPYFMIPSLTRNSMRLAGNIGAKIGQLGHRAGGGVRNAISKSRAAERSQRRIELRRNQRAANRFERSSTRTAGGTTFRGVRGNTIDRWRMRRGGRENYAQSQMAVNRIEEEQDKLRRAADPNYIQTQRLVRADREHEQNINGLIYGIRRNGQLRPGGVNYGIGGSNTQAVMGRIIELSNNYQNLSQEDHDELEALFRISGEAGNNMGIDALNDLTFGATANGQTLNNNGVRAISTLRLTNPNIAGNLHRRNGLVSRYYQNLAAGTVGVNDNWTRAQIGAQYVRAAFSDSGDVNNSAGRTLHEFRGVMPLDISTRLINDRNFNTVVTDNDKRNDIIDSMELNHRMAQRTAGSTMRTYGTMTGTYFAAPAGWVLDTARSIAASAPIFRSTNINHTRYYNAARNRFDN